ncbi:hypothetical protein LSTR_LSTR009219 [Laodelphax striatellus]|uniref:Symplekin n=1 Tax=Laodelphax striatellus TaxID=195883 RepID=A0A482WQL1_LAOST|nr:hypothetical protein LSTR_LSTR009219 [Laodelphax striatellus]
MAFHRSPAAQYFLDSENKNAASSSKDGDKTSEQKVVEWINEASLVSDTNRKIELLRMVQEFIIHKEPHILDNFLHEVVGFQIDKNAEVRKFIVGFIEEACKKDCELLPKVVPNLQILLQDSSPQVQKRVIQAASQVYKSTLAWVSKATLITEEMKAVWVMMGNIKKAIVDLVDSDNDGIRTHTVKFLETLVLCQTYPEEDSLQRENDFSLEDLPLGMKIARRRKLEEEALTLFSLMVKFHGSEHISSVNLMTCMGSLTLIAKMRPTFMGKVIAALETLHMNLPPTLSKSQVSSVRKHLKLQLLNLLKHPKATDYLTNITTLLTDLGATYHEVMKAYPKGEPVRRKPKRPAPAESEPSKKLKMDEIKKEPADDSGGEEERRGAAPSQGPVTETSIDLTEKYIVERLSPEFTADLVITAMSKLPDSMPSVFSATYTPIAAAGTQGQIRHVARLLATQIAAAGLGPGNAIKGKTPWKDFGKKRPLEEDDDDEDDPSASLIVEEPKTANLPAVIQMPSKRSRRSLKLNEITKPLSRENREAMSIAAVKRILVSEKSAIAGGILGLRCKMVATMATSFNPVIRKAILDHILSDVRNNLLLGLSCLYEEYAYLQSFKRLPSALIPDQKKRDQNYGNLLKAFVETLINKTDLKERDMLLFRLFLEAPLITDEVVDILKQLSSRDVIGLTILQELVIRRPPKQIVYLNALLTYTSHESTEIRGTAISYIVMLYDRGELRSIIEEYSVMYLDFLRLPQPPNVLFGAEQGRFKPVDTAAWAEDSIKACLYLYLVLLPANQKLIHELARVYVQTIPDIKRVILRLVEVPVRGMGMDSPQLLSLVEDCPKGSETLVTRVIHILTDKGVPSPELVAKVRELYQTRVSDVRFLIPVLNGLTKKEVIAALPKLIKLNPIVVKEVFNRLLGTHAEAGHTSPISPAELLIALHNIDPTKCELKTVIKATSLCFAEKSAYTQEVLAVVMQNLMEISPLPTLLMRTVIQSLSLYPRLIGFVINILQRLILKQVWKQKKVWEGFIKCCQRTKPQSFQVLLQLPAPQLADVFENSPDLKQPVLNHVMSFTDNQRAHIPQSVMDILIGPEQPIYPMYTVKNEPMSPPELMIDIKDEPSDDAKMKAAQLRPEPVQPTMEPAPPGAE